jgi:hypothetical protein
MEVRARVLEAANGSCLARTPDCRGAASQTHHRKGRDGDLVDNPEFLLAVCWACHNHIHQNPAMSYERGWMLRRNGGDNEHHGRDSS